MLRTLIFVVSRTVKELTVYLSNLAFNMYICI